MPETEPPSLSRKEAIILDLLVGAGERYGLRLVEESGGRLKRGTVYVTLSRMEDKGFVESRQEERDPHASGIPRRLYRITGLGERAFRQVRATGSDLAVTLRPGLQT
jgi:DNA-binding PadR family transcriptional regulator